MPRSPQSETEREFCDILQMADPLISQFVARHEALRERVTVLERALERVTTWNPEDHPEDAWRVQADAQAALDG